MKRKTILGIAVIAAVWLAVSGCERSAGASLTKKVKTKAGTITIEMVRIPAGTFTMGSPASEPNRNNGETQHQVRLSAFYMGKYPVTQEQYEAVMGANPSRFTTANGTPTAGEAAEKRPVERVSWYDAIVFCNRLSMAEGLSPAYRATKTLQTRTNGGPYRKTVTGRGTR